MKTLKERKSRKRKSAAIAALLGVVFLFLYSCANDSSSGGNAQTPRTSVPAELTGDWYTGNISSVNFFNPITGQWGAPSGTGIFFKFTPDGYYEKGVLLQSSLYGCTMSFFAYNKGTMTVEADRIVIYPTYGRIKSVDNCVADNNYEKADQLKQETLFWEIGPDGYGGTALWLRYENSNPSAFYPE